MKVCRRDEVDRAGAGDGAVRGSSKSQVSKLCKDIDERVAAFLDRPLVEANGRIWLAGCDLPGSSA